MTSHLPGQALMPLSYTPGPLLPEYLYSVNIVKGNKKERKLNGFASLELVCIQEYIQRHVIACGHVFLATFLFNSLLQSIFPTVFFAIVFSAR